MGKAYTDYTLNDIYRLNMSFLKKNRTDDEIAYMASNMAYLMSRAKGMGLHELITTNFCDVFDRETFHTLQKKDINKVLSDALMAKSTSMGEASQGQEEYLAFLAKDGHFAVDLTAMYMKPMEKLERELALFSNSLRDYETEINNLITKLVKTREEHDELSIQYEEASVNGAVDEAKITAIKEATSDNKWVYLGFFKDFDLMLNRYHKGVFSRRYVLSACDYYMSTQDISVAYKNESAGIDYNHTFGKVVVGVNREGKPHRAYLAQNFTTNAGGSQHPHVNAEGDICWGSALSTVNLRATRDKVKSTKANLDTLHALLTSYSPDNPYITFGDLIKRDSNKQRIANALLVTDKGYAMLKENKSPLVAPIIQAYEAEAEARKYLNDKVNGLIPIEMFPKQFPDLHKVISANAKALVDKYYNYRSTIAINFSHDYLKDFRLEPNIYHVRLVNHHLPSDYKIIGYIGAFMPIGAVLMFKQDGKLFMGKLVKFRRGAGSEIYDQFMVLDNGEEFKISALIAIVALPADVYTAPPLDEDTEEDEDEDNDDFLAIEDEYEEEDTQEEDEDSSEEESSVYSIPF